MCGCKVLVLSLVFETSVGGRIFSLEATQALKVLKRYAKLLKYQHAEVLTWKAVRAGKTTALALQLQERRWEG